MQRFSYGDKDTGSQPQRQRPSLLTYKLFAVARALATAAILGISSRFSITPSGKAAYFTHLFLAPTWFTPT